MQVQTGDIIEIMYQFTQLSTVRVFGEVLGTKNNKIRMSIWDGTDSVMEYDEIIVEVEKVVDCVKSEVAEYDYANQCFLH